MHYGSGPASGWIPRVGQQKTNGNRLPRLTPSREEKESADGSNWRLGSYILLSFLGEGVWVMISMVNHCFSVYCLDLDYFTTRLRRTTRWHMG